MPRYSYKAIDKSGELLEGEAAADSREALIARLRHQGVVPIRADALGGSKGAKGKTERLARGKGRKRRDLIVFVRGLAILLQAGFPLDRALATLSEGEGADSMRGVAQQLLSRVKSGSTLAVALESCGDTFPPFFIGMVRAGEAGGHLDQVLADLSDYAERAQALRDEIRSALVYPMLVLVLTVASLVVMLTLVVPEFRPLFEDVGTGLPLVTRVVLALSQATVDWGWAFGVGFLLLVLAFGRIKSSQAVRDRLDNWVLGIPLFGALVRTIDAARFSRALGPCWPTAFHC